MADGWSEFLKRFTYKPGWSFVYYDNYDISENRFRDSEIKVVMMTEDAYHPGKMIPVHLSQKVLPIEEYGEEHAAEILRDIIRQIEMHEVDEWFKKDGALIHDPHAPLFKINKE